MGRPKKIIIQPEKLRTFEECYGEISAIINTRRFKWHLTSVPSISWEDIAQVLLRHLFVKWHLYDQSRPLKSWVLVVANNQILNQLRNNYGNFQKVCTRCEFYEGNELCKKYGTCDSSKCDLLKMWERSKKMKHDINLPLPMENHLNECQSIQSQDIDMEKTSINLHEKMKTVLKPLDLLVYEMLYVKKMDESDVAKKLKFTSNEPGRFPGYSRISQIKKSIMIEVKKVLKEGDVEIVGSNQ